MSPAPPEPEKPDRVLRLEAILRRVPGVVLGLLVLWQLVFLIVYNLFDIESTWRDLLREAREDQEPVWESLEQWPQTQALLAEWLDTDQSKEDKGRLGNALATPKLWVNWWARRAGQEQGWGLFAPNAWDAFGFLSVEYRWDKEDAQAARPPVRVRSDNQPANLYSYFRVGNWASFRVRRIEMRFDIDLRRNRENPDVNKMQWEHKITDKVRREQKELTAYLRWKYDRYCKDHPDEPPPEQLVLHIQTWTVPAPPGPSPWDWTEEVDTPVARLLPGATSADDKLEVYLPTTERYTNP